MDEGGAIDGEVGDAPIGHGLVEVGGVDGAFDGGGKGFFEGGWVFADDFVTMADALGGVPFFLLGIESFA